MTLATQSNSTQEDQVSSVGSALSANPTEGPQSSDMARGAPVGILKVDADGQCRYVNDYLCDLLGLSALQALGNGWVSALHPEDRDSVVAAWAEAARSKAGLELEFRVQRSNADVTWVLCRGVAFRGLDEKDRGHIGTLTDITAQVEARSDVQRAKAQLQTILEHTQSAVFIKDLTGRYLFHNRKALFGATVNSPDILGKTDHDLMPRAIADTYRDNDLLTLKSGAALKFEEPGPIETQTFATEKFPLMDACGKAYAICGVSTDITDRKAVEDELARANQNLRTLSHRLLEVQEIERRRIAHELHDGLGQVLAALKLDLSAMSRKPGAHKLKQCMETLDAAQKMVRDLSHDLRPPSLDDIGIEAALGSIVDQHRKVSGHAVEFKCDIGELRPRKDVEVAAYRVVQEALSNVIRHAKANTVSLSARRFQGDLHLEIADNGKGFDVTAALTRAGPNRGIGVESMRERMSRIGGYVNIMSVPGHGTRITAGFPNAWPDGEVLMSQPSMRARVVCVDDHQLVRAGIRSILEGIEGVEVVGEAQNGEVAMQLVRTVEPDIVITDIKMPVMDGLSLTKTLAREHPKVRTLILSLYPDAEYVEKAFQLGATGYLVKDNAQEELEMAIRSTLRGQSFISPAVSSPILRKAAQTSKSPSNLPQRQLEILRLLADGANTKEIAAELRISPKTVDAHRARIMRRVGVRDAAGLVRFAVQNAHSLAAA